MAKLNSHGRTLARFKRVVPPNGTDPEDHGTTYEYSIHTDGHILKKISARIDNGAIGGSYWHSWGWKLWKKAKPGTDPTRLYLLFLNKADKNGIPYQQVS
tara:strand:- start:662 stop:961 length:300 start_codon:yes stop_codon:yes gene_type:complete